MKKNGGFTLIELLAVIIILTVIAVISVPRVLKLIENSRYTSYISSLASILKAVEISSIDDNILDGQQYDMTGTSPAINISNDIKSIDPKIQYVVTYHENSAPTIIANYGGTTPTSGGKWQVVNMDKPQLLSTKIDPNDATKAFGKTYKNLALNGNFSNGTTNWNGTNATISSNGTDGISIAIAQYGGIIQYLSNPTSFRGHKMYGRSYFKSNYNGHHMIFFNDGYFQMALAHNGDNTFRPFSAISVIDIRSNSIYFKTQDNRTSGWTESRLESVLVVDLTEMFGVGNEPSQVWCDTNLPFVVDTGNTRTSPW